MDVNSYLHSVLHKLANTFLARRWYVQTTHDPNFPSRIYRKIWADSSEGQQLLTGRNVEDEYMQQLFAKSMEVSRLKESRHVMARNRILQAYARVSS